jgi:hypothetical protein
MKSSCLLAYNAVQFNESTNFSEEHVTCIFGVEESQARNQNEAGSKQSFAWLILQFWR